MTQRRIRIRRGLHDTSWMLQGACNGTDPNLWYADRGEAVDQAKAVCSGCVVREACLEYALGNREQEGVWGGLAPLERRAVQRQRATAAKVEEEAV